MKLHSILLAFILIAPFANARTIDWGSAIGDTIVQSNGTPLTDSFIFELGTFGSFTPDEFNLDMWLANWKVFDRAIAPAASGWDSANGFVSSSATLQTDGSSSAFPTSLFAEGEQAYIWAYNGFSIDSLTEWALVTNNDLDGNPLDNWTMPAHADQTAQPLDWRLSNATAVPFGGLNDEEGPGAYTVDPGIFNLQTHTVPEPSGMILALVAGVLGLVGRRRK